jgi:hypothetical protein
MKSSDKTQANAPSWVERVLNAEEIPFSTRAAADRQDASHSAHVGISDRGRTKTNFGAHITLRINCISFGILPQNFSRPTLLRDSFQPESKYHSAMSATTPQMALAQPSKFGRNNAEPNCLISSVLTNRRRIIDAPTAKKKSATQSLT